MSAPPAAAQSAPAGAAAGQAGSFVIDVAEADFNTDVIQASYQVPVVIDFWAAWCGPCRQLSPVLEKFAAADGGAWILAKVDVDANPRLAQAAQVQGIPAVKAVLDGQIVSEFTGAPPAAQVRQWLDSLIAAAGPRTPAGAAAAAETVEPEDPDLDRAEQALAEGDLPAAAEAFRAKLAKAPSDPYARAGLAQVELMLQSMELDPVTVAQRQQADPDDVQAAIDLSRLQVLAQEVEPALDRLIALVSRTAGDERDQARTAVLGLLEALGDDHPAVKPARRRLTSALF